MTVYCAVPGCSSNSKTTDCTFHRFPRNLISQARWILALRRPLRTLGSCAQVCGRHFEESMFSDRGRDKSRGLVKNAVPTLYLPGKQSTPLPVSREQTLLFETEPAEDQLQAKLPKVVKSRPDITKHSDEAASSGEVEVEVEVETCRVCLAADGRLYSISGSGLEDALAALTGVAMPEAEGVPRHLCVFCRAKLSTCAAFRDSCQRATALLQSLLEKGPLTISDFESVDRHTNELKNTLTQAKLYHFQADPFLDIMSLSKNQDDSLQVPDYTEVEYLESDEGMDNTEQDINPLENYDTIKIELEVDDTNTHSEIDDGREYKVENDTSDFDTDTSEETVTTVNKRNRLKLEKESTAKHPRRYENLKTKVDYDTDIDTDTSEEIVELRKKVELTKLLLKEKSTKTTETELLLKEESTKPTETEAFVQDDQAKSIAAFEKEFNCKIKVFSKDEQKQEVEERKRNNTSAYCCDLCGKGYRNESTLRTHLSYHDPSLPLECDVCRFRFRSRLKLLKHRSHHHAIYTCNECGNVSRDRGYAKSHYLMHQGATYPCPYCQTVYHHKTSYHNHVRMQHPGQNEACDLCGETFAAGRGIMLHKALAHKQSNKPNVDLKCTDCKVTFLSAAALQRHRELFAGAAHAALWACAACGDACGSPDALAAHAAEQHPPPQRDQHHCDECNKTFLNAESFALHVDRKHRNRRASVAPFRNRPRSGAERGSSSCVCEVCGKVLKNSTFLQYHMNGHLEVKPFQCRRCPKAFTQQGALNLHMRVHTGERPYQCEKCPLAFALRGNFTRHMKTIHLQQRKLARCDACGKVMGAASLAQHVRFVHQNQPYVRRKRNRTEKLPLATES